MKVALYQHLAVHAALALVLALSVMACQKSDGAAPCGTNSAGSVSTFTAGAGPSVGGAESVGGCGYLGGGGSGAAAATDGSGAAAATGGASEVAGGAGAPPDSTTCSALTVAECASNMSCQGLSAQPIVGTPPCLGPFKVVACGTKLDCLPKATRGKDTQGQDWIFPSTCIPATWANSSQSGTRFDACMSAGASGSGGAGGGSGSSGDSSSGGSAG